MRIMTKVLSVFCCSAVLAGALPLQAAAAEAEKMPSGLKVADIQKTIEDYAEQNKSDYACFAAAVFDRDGILYADGFGDADPSSGRKADASTVYEWGSVSKTMIWVSAMQLYEQGKLDLEADVRGYLPDGFFQHLRYDDKITMLNLMNHSGGWGENTWSIQTPNAGEIVSLHDALRNSEPYQLYRPGELSSYSNWGAALAGYVIECVSGEDYCDYVHKHILEPLGMEQTSVNPTHSDNEWVKTQRETLECYQNAGDSWVPVGKQLTYINLYPAGAVTGSITDMARYGQAFLAEKCPLFEKQETFDLLLTQSAVLSGTDIGYCYHGFWSTDYKNTKTYGHDGGTNGCSSVFQFDPVSGIGVAAMTSGGGAALEKMTELIYGEQEMPDTKDLGGDIKKHEDISGLYHGVRSNLHGPMRWMGLANVLPILPAGADSFNVVGIATINRLSDDVLQLNQNGFQVPLVGKNLSDGGKMITLGEQSYISKTENLVGTIGMVVLVLFTLIGALMLFIKLILLIAKKRKKFIGRGIMTLAQLARLVSVGVLVWFLTIYGAYYGLPKLQGMIGIGIQAVCLLIYVLAVLTDLRGMFSRSEEKAGFGKYFINLIANGGSIFAVFALELIRFWGV